MIEISLKENLLKTILVYKNQYLMYNKNDNNIGGNFSG